MEKSLNFIIAYGKETFIFKQSSKAFILHAGIENEIDEKYGYHRLIIYLQVVPPNFSLLVVAILA